MPKTPATVRTPGRAHTLNAERLTLYNALLGGTSAMRAAGELYLPQYERESDKVWRNRLDRAVLFNYFKRACASLAGRPFRNPVKVSKMSPKLKPFLRDVDTRGTSLTSFAHTTFRSALARGLMGILVDYPTGPADGPVTLAAAKQQAARPYMVPIFPESLLAVQVEIVGGREVVTHARILETVLRRNGWEEVATPQVRVLEPGRWEVYAPKELGKNSETDAWERVDAGVSSFQDEVPLVLFYAGDREAPGAAESPLDDLAHACVEHWQSAADQKNALTVARFPILAATGVEDDKALEVGPNKWLRCETKDGKFFYVEHTGAALQAGRQELADLEARMAALSEDLLVRRTSDRASATGKVLDATASVSVLQALVLNFGSTLDRALGWMERWLGVEKPEAQVEMDSSLDEALRDQAELDFLKFLRTERGLSMDAMIREAQRRNILPEGFDSAKNDAELASEPESVVLSGPPPRDEDDEGADE